MKKLQINIFDTDLKWQGLIEEVESFIHRTSWHESVISELRVSKKSTNYSELQIGRILVVNNQWDKALIIEEINTTLTDNFSSYICSNLKGILNWRVLAPIDSPDYIAEPQAAVMMKLVSSQLIEQTRDTKRYFTNSQDEQMLAIDTIKNYGRLIDYISEEWNTGYLGDILTEISKMNEAAASYPIGWNITIKDFASLVFDTFEATNRSVNQTERPPVVFSDRFANLQNISFTESIKEWRNVLYAVYSAEDILYYLELDRAEVYGESKGFNRKEMIIQSNQTSAEAVTGEGLAELNKRPKVESFTAEIIDNPNTLTTYQIDWFLGDIVTVQSRQLGISMDVQITQIEEIYANSEYSLNVTFGEGKLNLIQLIKNELNILNKKG
jgi:hypothetical protein